MDYLTVDEAIAFLQSAMKGLAEAQEYLLFKVNDYIQIDGFKELVVSVDQDAWSLADQLEMPEEIN
jgi:uncharacterized membrane-anchored protein YitT (DUF2179 family)